MEAAFLRSVDEPEVVVRVDACTLIGLVFGK